jgi:DNA-binding CsgD family transcriptional regulator
MSAVESVATGLDRRDTSQSLAFERPGELVDISERIYQHVFAIGLRVATLFTAVATAASLLQPVGSRLAGLVVGGAFVVMTGVAASLSAPAYRRLRRHPWTLVIPGAILGLGALIVGPHNAQLFLAMIVIIGVTGVAVPRRVVVVAGIVAAAGLAAPQLIHGQDNLGGALVVVVPPLMYWLIIERIAGFALRLHRSLSTSTGTPPRTRRTADPEPDVGNAATPPTEASADRPQLALPQPGTIEVAGIHLTARQLQVTLLACEGLTHPEIGRCLDIGPQQVLRHLRRAEARTGSASTPQLVAWAREADLAPRPGARVSPSESIRPPRT